MAKSYELRKVWGIGPFKRRKLIATFDSLFVAKHTMKSKILTAKRKNKKVLLEVTDKASGKVIYSERSF